MCNSNLNSRSGQSLVEMIMAVGLVAIVLVGLISAITFSLTNSQYARNKTLATKFAQEGIEWARNQRDSLNWNVFYAYAAIGVGRTYCLNSLSFTSPGSCAANTVIPNTIFTRQINLVANGIGAGANQDRVAVNIQIIWPQGNRTGTVVLNSFLSKWK